MAAEFYCGACGRPCTSAFNDFGEDSKKMLNRSECCESLLFDSAPSIVNFWSEKEASAEAKADDWDGGEDHT